MIVFTFELTFNIPVQTYLVNKKNEKTELDRNTATAEHSRDIQSISRLPVLP